MGYAYLIYYYEINIFHVKALKQKKKTKHKDEINDKII